jgi:hypothetical protein
VVCSDVLVVVVVVLGLKIASASSCVSRQSPRPWTAVAIVLAEQEENVSELA